MSYILAGTSVSTPLFNAAGCNCTSETELNDLDKSLSGGIVSKSCTMNYREGNQHPRYFADTHGSINSTGLANYGYSYYKNISKTFTKPFILSISTLNCEHTTEIVKDYASYNPGSLVEINVSCPNIAGKPQLGYNIKELDKFIKSIFDNQPDLRIGFKLPPYFDQSHISKVSDILKSYPVSFITCINSLGNGLMLDDCHKPVIFSNSGLGGIGGDYCKPFGLSNVYQFNRTLSHKMDIMGCGGITNGKDVIDYLSCGAKVVQIGTQLIKENTDVFARINKELNLL